ncbi:MAG TPA: ATP synthase F1 subunit epsilon [Acidimicrobiales bacterium]|nr:ATP synthase F1 subunit epsilon [Acidimicrobiales bacterium]
MATTQFELVTPTRTLYSGYAEMIVCRTVDGEIAFLANHMAYIGALDPGLVKIVGPQPDSGESSTEPDIRLAVQGGFVEVSDNRVIMLADVAELASDVDVEAARADEEEAKQRLSAAGSEGDPAADKDLRWAQARLEAATGAEIH